MFYLSKLFSEVITLPSFGGGIASACLLYKYCDERAWNIKHGWDVASGYISSIFFLVGNSTLQLSKEQSGNYFFLYNMHW